VIFTNRYEVKKFLESYKLIQRKVETLYGMLREIEADLTSLKAIDYSKVRVNSGGSPSCVQEVILDRKNQIEKDYLAAIESKYIIQAQVIEFINQISNKDRDVDMLIDKHIHLLSTSALCKKYNYAEEVIYNKIYLAHKKLAKISIIKKEER
jgi:hypothetical protein